jgi:glutamine cyclotransferase
MPDPDQLDEFLGALEALQGQAGNGRLRELLGWDEGSYDAAKAELVAKGIVVNGREEIAVLTWREEVVSFRDPTTLTEVRQARYDGEGWGLCAPGDGTLVMSDGSDRLTVRDPATFDAVGSVVVTRSGSPLGGLNELECHDGLVWANVWPTDLIVAIDPATGVVLAEADLSPLRSRNPGGDVTNGIAQRPGTNDEFVVGGKWWREHYLVRLVPAPSATGT